jgi:DNA-binding MarR family transcriptional regulator
MLLFLFSAELEGRVIMSGELYASSGAPPTTGFRRLDDLYEAGLITRVTAPEDGRRVIVQLTPKGSGQIRSLITSMCGAHDLEAQEGADAVERSESA